MAAREPEKMPHSAMGLILAAWLVATSALTGPARADGLEAGLWRSVQTPTLNGVATPPRESMRCLRSADVNDLDRTFSPVYGTTNSACERVEHEFTPQRLRWRLQCRGQLDMDVAGEFVFERSDRYTATIVAVSSMLGKIMQEVHTRIEAQRVGECQ
jgi:Protein of unknown function (DUF3617)